MSVEAYYDMIGDSAERVLQGTFRRRVCEGRGGGKMVEPVWMTKEIRVEIRMRREYNRRKRRVREEDVEK